MSEERECYYGEDDLADVYGWEFLGDCSFETEEPPKKEVIDNLIKVAKSTVGNHKGLKIDTICGSEDELWIDFIFSVDGENYQLSLSKK